ncbi:hypothetical protein JCM10207_001929 [Rhodosporidiobolus poonsookiae]
MSTEPWSGQLHNCSDPDEPHPPLTAFELSSTSSYSPNLLLWVGGLSDVLGSAVYLSRLGSALAPVGWGVAQAGLRSAAHGWGGFSVADDAQGLAQIVRYFKEKRGKDKVVLMGFSTGCQDAIAYLHLHGLKSFPNLAGVILQAPVSDREAIQAYFPDVLPSTPRPEPGTDLAAFVPHAWSSKFWTRGGVTYKRWWSLAAKPDTDEINLDESEDFFSSDLSPQRYKNVFAPLAAPILFLLGDKDMTYPPAVRDNLPEQLERLKTALPDHKLFSPLSAVLAGAGHQVAEEAPQAILVEKVVEFVKAL